MIFWSSEAQNTQSETGKHSNSTEMYASFGEKIEANGAIGSKEMLAAYETMTIKDSLQTKFTGTVMEVCKAKGCWMKVALDNGEEAMVRFKDYGFFMPKDIEGKEVVLRGLGFKSILSVEDQRHYAKDAGTSEEDLKKITTDKKTYSFEADGVLLKQ